MSIRNSCQLIIGIKNHLPKPFDAYGWPTHYYPILSNRTDSDNNGLRECRVKIDFDPFWQEGYYSYKEVEALKGDVRKCITIYNRSLQYVGLEFKEVDDESYHILIETTDDPELKDNAGWATSFGAWSFDKSILQLRRNYEHFGAYQYLLEKGASNALYKRPPGNPYAFVYSLDNFWTMRNGKNFFREPISEVVMHEMGHLVGIMHPFLALNNTQNRKGRQLFNRLAFLARNWTATTHPKIIYIGWRRLQPRWLEPWIHEYFHDIR